MAGEIATRRLSLEFWAIVGAAVTLLMAIIGIAALVLTVAGWHREDIRSLDAKLSAEIKALDVKLSGEIKALDVKLSGEIKALDAKLSAEIKALDAKLSGELNALDAKLSAELNALDAIVAAIDKRLAVVESHVLGMRSIDEGGRPEETQALQRGSTPEKPATSLVLRHSLVTELRLIPG